MSSIITVNKEKCTIQIHERQSDRDKLRKVEDRQFKTLLEMSIFVGKYVQNRGDYNITYIGVLA